MFAPDEELAKRRYRQLAERYDHATRRMEPIRCRAVAALGLAPGQRVLDVACGTGRCLPLLSRAVGEGGEVVGVEQSPDMLAQARARVAGLRNVTLVEAPVQRAALPGRFDALLFCYSHDVLTCPRALANVFAAARPGARVVATGTKLFPWYLGLANLYLLAVSWRYFTSPGRLRRPWALLAGYVPDLAVEPLFFGSGYFAVGSFEA